MKRYKHRKHQNSGRRFRKIKKRFNAVSNKNFYRSRNGIFMGVCRGFAEYFDISVFWTRMIVLALFLFTGFWPVGVMYIVAGLVFKVEPVVPFHTEHDHEFYNSYTQSRKSAIQRVKKKFENIERRIQRMEHIVTSKEFDWK